MDGSILIHIFFFPHLYFLRLLIYTKQNQPYVTSMYAGAL